MRRQRFGEVVRVRERIDIPRTGAVMAEGERHGNHDRTRSDDDDHRPENGIRALVWNPSRRDALVDDVGLLEKELPRRDGGSDDRDDEEHAIGLEATLHTRDDEMLKHGTQRWVTQKHQRDAQQVSEKNDEHQPLPRLETPGHGDADKEQSSERYGDPRRDSEVLSAQRYADELRRNREEVEDEQIAHGESTPDLAETLEDKPPMPNAGNGAEAHHHLLVDDQHRDEQQQHPEQTHPVVLPGSRVRRDATCVVVPDHHDETRADDHSECEEPATQSPRA